MNIRDIILIIIIIYVFYLHSKINKNNNIEKFALSTDDKNEVRALIKEIYNTDMDAIRTLAKMADDIQKTGLQVNGNLIVTGSISSTGSLTCTGTINSDKDIISKSDFKIIDKDNISKATLTGVKSTSDTNSTSISTINTSLTNISTSLSNKLDNNTTVNIEIQSSNNRTFYSHNTGKRLAIRNYDNLLMTWHNPDDTSSLYSWKLSKV